LKYRSERHLGRALGLLLADSLEAPDHRIDALVGVPLHPRRLRARGFNQANEIAAPIARALGRPLLQSGFRRILATRPQTELDRSARLRAPLGSFAVSRNLAGLGIAIVDDVITTGATVDAFAATIRAAGAVRVEAWSVARSVGRTAAPDHATRKI
jgi:ComF family protein